MVLPPFDLQSLAFQYDQPTPENIELKDFINTVIGTKQMRFTQQEVGAKYSLLLSSNLIGQDGVTMAGKDISFQDDARIYYALFRGFSAINPYSFTGGINDLEQFYHWCFKEMEVNGQIWPGGVTMEKYRRFLFMAAFKAGHFDPIEQIDTLDKSEDNYPRSMMLYLENWQFWNYPFEKFWMTSGKFAEAIGLQRENVGDFRWTAIYGALQQNLNTQVNIPSVTTFMVSFIGTNTWGAMADYGLAVLSKIGQIQVSEILFWITDPVKTTTSLILLLQEKTFTQEDSRLLYSHFSNISLDERQQFLWYNLIVYLLEHVSDLPTDLEHQLQSCLQIGISSEVESHVVAVINALQGYRKKSEFCTQLIHQLVKQVDYLTKYNAVIASYFFRVDSLDGFFEFIYTYASQKHIFKLTPFQNICDAFYDKYPEEFIRKTIELTIDDWGYVRKAGLRILSHQLRENRGGGLLIKPEGYNAFQQYKIIKAVTSSPMLMEELISCLVPFLSVKSAIVRELALCKLDIVVEDDKLEAIDKITPMLEQLPDKVAITQRLQNSLTAYLDKMALSHKIPEFDVRVAYPKHFRQFMIHHVVKNQDSMEKARQQHRGISTLLPTTIVARGGGNIMADGSVVPMNSFSAAFSLPARIWKDPVSDELAIFLFNTTNWSKESEEWKQTILSSENI